VIGDPGRFRQILINLIGNALKFTDRGEVFVTVNVEPGEAQQKKLRVEIKDTGIGMTEAARLRLFKPFTQVDDSASRRYGGTGLGLAISKQLVELMHGNIGVESQLGVGSTFWFTVVLGFDPHAQPKSSELADLSGKNILVVDDNETNRRILQRHLTRWGAVTAEACSGAEALMMLQDGLAVGNACDAILLDYFMPAMDGLQVAAAIRACSAFSVTPIILLSSELSSEQRSSIQQQRISATMQKPIRASVLLRTLRKVFDPRSTAAEPARQKLESAPPAAANPRAASRILIGEDKPTNQVLARRMVEKLGYEAEVAGNGALGVDAWKTGKFDLILMDCQMPEKDGYVATREIRAAEAGKGARIPIIAMTANAVEGDRERCLAAGMDDYLTKPVKFADLGSAITRWIAKRTASVSQPTSS
jgi:CheY-like chemotaxis protein